MVKVLSGGQVLEISDTTVLVDRCKQGQNEAWRTLFDTHYDFVQRVARSLGTPAEELDDVCQETFLVVFRKIDTFSDGRFTTWLYRISANISSARHRRRRFRWTLARLVGREWHQASVPSPERSLEQNETRQAVNQVLAAMKPKKREVFALYEIQGLSGKEIAERVGCTVNTVWARLHHARKDFARIAKKQGLASGTAET